MRKLLLAVAGAALIAGCGDKAEVGTDDGAEVVEVERTPQVVLSEAIASPRRAEDAARDAFRNPAATLEFFELAPGQRVAEIWPGYYTEIIAPYFNEVGGEYVAVLFPEGISERADERVAAAKAKYADASVYGNVQFGSFGYQDGERLGTIAEPGSLDAVLTFRNVHNWMGGGYADQAFTEFYEALKPGGLLGVVEHRLPEARRQDPQGTSGYVQESYVKDLAARAGFEFVEASEVNANPLDTADHPMGVWTLPPRSRTPEAGTKEAEDFDAELYRNIGESDRMTLKFRKPG